MTNNSTEEEPITTNPTTDECTLMAVGDIYLDREDPLTAFAAVSDLFSRHDIVLGNLEAPVSERTELPPWAGKFPLRMRPEMTAGLVAAPFTVLSLANNHAMDFGAPAILDTIDELSASGLSFTGAGRDLDEASRATVAEAGGVRVGFIGVQATDHDRPDISATKDRPGLNQIRINPYFPPPYADPVALRRLGGAIRAAKGISDIVVAVCHWGLAGATAVTTTQLGIARAAVAAGADLVVGHHSHVPQAFAALDGRPVAFGLGNFLFDWSFPHFTPPRLIAEFRLGREGVREAAVRFGWADPELELVALADERIAEALATFLAESAELGSALVEDPDGQRLQLKLREEKP